MLHDSFVIDAAVRQQADRPAAAGYLTLSVDLFAGRRPALCLMRMVADLRARRGRTSYQIDAAQAWLAARRECTGRLGVLGFCATGGFALLLTAGHGYAVAGVNYGAVPADAAQALRGACPVVALFGGRDRSLPGDAGRLEEALRAAGVEHDVVEYPEAGHSFLHPDQWEPGLVGALMQRFTTAATTRRRRRTPSGAPSRSSTGTCGDHRPDVTRRPAHTGTGPKEAAVKPQDYSARTAYRPPAAWYRRLNWLGVLLTSVGLAPRDAVTLQVRGRTSGKTRRVPVLRTRHRGADYLIALAGESQWARNVRAAGGRAMIRRRAARPVALEELSPAQRPEVIAEYLSACRRRSGPAAGADQARYYFGLGPDASLDEIDRIAGRYPVFRIDYLDEPR